MRYNTLLLDQTAWDMVLDANGDIAIAQPPYAVSQDVVSALKTFLGEVFYDSSMGIPYFDEILGHLPPTSLLRKIIEDEAKTVSGVVKALLILQKLDNRSLSAQLEFIDEQGITDNVKF